MEGALIYLVGITYIYILTSKEVEPKLLALITVLAIMTRPEFGLLALGISTVSMFSSKQIKPWLKSVLMVCGIYCFICFLLHVYPIPTTLLSKDLTSRLNLFGSQNLLSSLPKAFSQILFSSPDEIYGFAAMVFVCLFCLALLVAHKPKGWLTIPLAILYLTFVASRLTYFAWYSENYFVMMLLILVGCFYLLKDVEIKKWKYGTALILMFCLSLLFNSGMNKNITWPWNEGSGRYTAYESIGNDSVGQGQYRISVASDEDVRIRMCEIGLVAYFSGNDSWIIDSCGLAQPGELLTRATSPLSILYPSKVLKTGSQELTEISAITGDNSPIFEIWGLDIAPISGVNAGCENVKVEAFLCINSFSG